MFSYPPFPPTALAHYNTLQTTANSARVLDGDPLQGGEGWDGVYQARGEGEICMMDCMRL